MDKFQLYDYQQDLVDRSRKAYREGYRSPCIVLGCGGGKSIIIAEVIKQSTDQGNRVLFLVHRKELREQIQKTLERHGVNMDYVELGMVMTIVRRLDRIQRPDLIIIDENHHVLAKSYKKILDHFNTHVLGFTATPIRLNGDGLGDVNDVLLEGPSVEWLIDNKRLAPFTYYTVDLTDHAKLKRNSTGDYSNKSMDEALGEAIYGDVIKTYKEIAQNKKAILYAHNVEFSKQFAKEFNGAGVSAKHIDAKTPKEERDQTVQSFRNGDINILCNVDILGEGFDVPDCEVVVMVRPTESLSLYIQQSMRPMRYQPDKEAIIIDHVGNVYRHGLPDMHREWYLDKRPRAQREQVDPYPVHTCDKCLMTYPKGDLLVYMQGVERISECPECGYKQVVENIVEKQEIKEAEIKKLRREELEKQYYKRKDWKTAKTYAELLKIANARGFKPAWAAFKAKELRLSDTPKWVNKWKPKEDKFELKLKKENIQ